MKDIEEMAREERNAYFRAWKAKNRDKVKAINKRYWEKRARKNAEMKKEDCNNER